MSSCFISVSYRARMNSELLCWAALPSPCLRQIFSFLPDEDRVRANLVCHHWHRVMLSPSLWRTRRFIFGLHFYKYRLPEHVTVFNFCCNYGKFLHRLEVDVIPERSARRAVRLEKAILTLFRALTSTNTQLRYLSIRGLMLNHLSWTDYFSHSLVRTLKDFLENGSCHLTTFYVTDMNNEMTEGLEILSALANSQASLVCLNTESYFKRSIAVNTNSLLPGVIKHLRALTDLTMDYTWVCDHMLIALSETSLKKLSIKCCSNMHPHQVVCGNSWVILKSKCPGLRVTMMIEQVINTDDLCNILQKEINLTDLTITNSYWFLDEQIWSPKMILEVLLPQYSCCLQRLYLDLKNCNAIDDELLEVTESLTILEVLIVRACLNKNTVDRILELKKPSFKTVEVSLYRD